MKTLCDDRQRMEALYRRVQVGVRKTSPTTCIQASTDMITQACHDVIIDNLVLHKGNFFCADTDVTAFDDKLAGFLVAAAINRLKNARRKHRVYSDRFGIRLDATETPTQGDEHAPVASAQIAWQPDNDDLHARSILGGDDLTAADQQRATWLYDCIARLTELARETYRLAILGCNDRDIQNQLGVASASTVRRRVHDAHKRVIDCVRRKSTTRAVT